MTENDNSFPCSRERLSDLAIRHPSRKWEYTPGDLRKPDVKPVLLVTHDLMRKV